MGEYFSNIVGNGELRERLASLLSENKLPHAIIIEGHAGNGLQIDCACQHAAVLMVGMIAADLGAAGCRKNIFHDPSPFFVDKVYFYGIIIAENEKNAREHLL